MKNRILSIVLFTVLLFNITIMPGYAQSDVKDAYNFDFSKCDSSTSGVNYNERSGRYESYGRDKYILFKNMEFSEAAYFVSMSMATGYAELNRVQICVDSKTNDYVTFAFETKDWNLNEEQKVQLERPIPKGTHDIYMCMISGYGNAADLKFYPKVNRMEDFSPEKLYTDINDFELRHRVVILTELGLLKEYEDNIFDANVPVTNSEFFENFYGLYEDWEELIGKYENEDEYIVTTLNNFGIIDYPYKNFKNDAYISDINAVKMVVRALGYEPLVNAKGGNETAYRNVAKDLDLDKGIKYDGSLQREEMARLLYNAIDTRCMTTTGFGSYGKVDYSSDETILKKNRNIVKGEGFVELTPSGTMYAGTETLEDTVSISGKSLRAGKGYAAAYIGRKCDYWYSEDTNVLLALDSQHEEVKIATYDDYQFDNITESRISYRKINGQKKNVRLKSDVKFIYNGMALTQSFADAGISADTFSGQIIFASNNGDKNYDVVILEEYKNVKFNGFTDDGMIDALTNETIAFDENDSVSIYGTDYHSILKSDLKYGDYLVVYASINPTGRKRVKIYAETSSVIGEISNLNRDDQTALIDGKKYAVAKEFLDKATMSLSAEYILNVYGEIVDCETPEETNWILGLLTQIKNRTDELGDDVVTVKIFAQDNLTEYYFAKKARLDGRVKKDFNALDTAIRMVSLNTPVRFKLNTDNKISAIDTVLQDAKDGFDTLKKVSSATSAYFFQGGVLVEKLSGKTVCPFNGTVINYYADGETIYDDMYSFSKFSTQNLSNNETPFTGDIYTTGENDDFPNVFICKNNYYPYAESVMTVTKKISEYDESIGDIRIILKGYDVNGKEVTYPVEMTLYNENMDNYKNIVDSIGVSDVIYMWENEFKKPVKIEFVFSNKERTRTVTPLLTDTVHFKYNNLSKRFLWGIYDGMLGDFVKVKYKQNDEWVTEYAKKTEKVLLCEGKNQFTCIKAEDIPVGADICVVWIGSVVKLLTVYK